MEKKKKKIEEKLFFLSCFSTKTWNKFLCPTLFHFDFHEYNSVITCTIRYRKCPLTFFYSFYFEFHFLILSFSTYIVDYLNNIHLKEEILLSILEFRKKKNFFFVMKVLSLRVNEYSLTFYIKKSFEYRSNDNTCPNIISIYRMLYDRKFTGYSRCCYLIIIGESYDNIL